MRKGNAYPPMAGTNVDGGGKVNMGAGAKIKSAATPTKGAADQRNTGIRRLWQSKKRDQEVEGRYNELGGMWNEGIEKRRAVQEYKKQGELWRRQRDNTQSVGDEAQRRIDARTSRSIGGAGGRTSGASATARANASRSPKKAGRRGVVTIEDI